MKPYLHILALAASVCHLHASVVFYEEIPYFSAADSPFYQGIQQGTIYLEDFEDHLLNTPYVVSWDSPRIIAVVNGIPVPSQQIGASQRLLGNIITTFSVDADDGLNGDFRGLLGDSWTTLDRVSGQNLGSMHFRFEPDPLGRYPSYAGFVVTEVINVFNDFEFGTGTLSPSGSESPDVSYDPTTWEPVETFPGDTRQHRFFGIYVTEGITDLYITNVEQIDHLQYGYAIPEPSVGALAGLGLLLLRRRRVKS